MRKRYPSIVRVLVALAMVASLVGLAVAPAGAAVTVTEVKATPATAGDTATYTITFDTGAGVGGGQAITVNFPVEVTLPGTIDKTYIGLTGCTPAAEGAPQPVVSGQDVIITVPTLLGNAVPGGLATLSISQGAGIRNPNVAKVDNYKVKVTTPEGSGEAFLTIIPSYKLSVSHAPRYTDVTVTGKGWANGGITIDGGAKGTGTAGTDGTFSIVCAPQDDALVTVKDGAGQTQGDNKWDVTGDNLCDVTPRIFELDPRVEITPTNGRVGTKATVKGYDFTSVVDQANAKIWKITVAGDATVTVTPALPQGPVSKDSFREQDDFSVDVTIPLDVSSGGVEVKAFDNGLDGIQDNADDNTAKATFTVAKPTLTPTPASGSPGDTLTVVATNFGANILAAGGNKVQFAGNDLVETNTKNLSTDSAGSFSVSFKVPTTAKSGYNKVTAEIGQGGKVTKASVDFFVAARLVKVVPDKGPKGIEVTLSAKDMSPGKAVHTLKIGDVVLPDKPANLQITTGGDLPVTTVKVPAGVTVGNNKVIAIDTGTDDLQNDNDLTAEGSFEVIQPTIDIEPVRGYMGDTVVVEGSGWIPAGDELVLLMWDEGGPNDKTLLTILPDANGNFKGRFTVPLNADDSTKVSAHDNKQNIAAPVFFYKEEEELTVDPQEGAVGSTFVVKGVGFQPQYPVEELSIGGATLKPITGVITDVLGSFEVEATVPGLAKGSYTVKAKMTVGGQVTEVTTFFTITEEEDTVVDALETCIDLIEIVWGYDEVADEWLFFDPDDPASDLEHFSIGAGYWVKASAACDLIYGGSSYSLPMGWKNIGWLGK